MKRLNCIFFLIIVLVLGFASCSSSESTAKVNKSTPSTIKTESITPKEIAKTFLESVHNREYQVVRECLSERSLLNLQQASSNSKLSLDQALKRIIDQDSQEMTQNNVVAFEFRNESINNDYATIEAKATNAAQYARISLIKENNKWKINIDDTTPSE
jgi:hypothetical protein